MEKPFRQILREYFNFSKKDRNAVLAIASVIVLFVGGKIFLSYIELEPSSDISEIAAILEEWESQTKAKTEAKRLFAFNPNVISAEALDSLNLPPFVKRNILNYRAAGGEFKAADDVRKIYGMNDSIFSEIEIYIDIPAMEMPEPVVKEKRKIEPVPKPFDPNTASKSELLSSGFNAFQASNIVRYRESGGSFLRSEDLLKIYGIDSAFYNSIAGFIAIAETPKRLSKEKKVLPFLIELNSTDSLELQKLSGIGPAFARRIINYRELLGGFYNKEQLLEVYGFPEETYHALKENLQTDSLKIKKVRINFASYSELLRHPYLKKEQVEAILNHREKNGPFSSTQLLVSEGLIDGASFSVLRHYITCR